MIPQSHINEWRNHSPWPEPYQVEQDLVLTKAIIQIYSDPHLKEAFAFRGGTAMQKLYFDPPARYSEDIDLVQIRKEAIGKSIDILRGLIDPWLGTPKRDLKKDRVTLTYRFQAEVEQNLPMKLKIEVNNGEHFHVIDFQRKVIKAESLWFSGKAEALTYAPEELLGTKLRALYQRKKGRDLFDMIMALKYFKGLDCEMVVKCFQKYMAHQKVTVTRAQYESNLHKKIQDKAFTGDIIPLLSAGAPQFDPGEAAQKVQQKLLSLLPGDAWKGGQKAEKKKK